MRRRRPVTGAQLVPQPPQLPAVVSRQAGAEHGCGRRHVGREHEQAGGLAGAAELGEPRLDGCAKSAVCGGRAAIAFLINFGQPVAGGRVVDALGELDMAWQLTRKPTGRSRPAATSAATAPPTAAAATPEAAGAARLRVQLARLT
jgi:hypothetical protein